MKRHSLAPLVAALAGLNGAAASYASAESQATCRLPTLYLAQNAIGIEASGEAPRVTLYAEGDGGSRELPIELLPSLEAACHSIAERGYRVVPREPLAVGEHYVLEQQRESANCSEPSTLRTPFIAVGDAILPALPAVTPPELLVERCPNRPQDYYYYEVHAPYPATSAGVQVRLSVDGDLHYCVTEGTRGVHCAAGERRVYRLQWVATVPHTGLRSDGPLQEVVLSCDEAREVPCSIAPLVSDAGARQHQDAAPSAPPSKQVEPDAGCRLARPGGKGGLWWLVGLLLLRSRRRG